MLSCSATPRVLPWLECPAAAASAARVQGRPVGELRALVKEELVGISTCTHLNDLLASLAQAGRPRPPSVSNRGSQRDPVDLGSEVGSVGWVEDEKSPDPGRNG